MKRKLTGMLVAAALLAQPLTSLAAGSISTAPTPSRDNTSSITESTTVKELGQGTVAAPSATSGSQAGGVHFTTNQEDLVNAGLNWGVIDDIYTINNGVEPLYRTIGVNTLVGYVPLAPMQAAMVGTPAESATVTMYVPNLLEGLNDIQILFYNQATHQWETKAPASINFATKEISVELNGAAPFTIIYKK